MIRIASSRIFGVFAGAPLLTLQGDAARAFDIPNGQLHGYVCTWNSTPFLFISFELKTVFETTDLLVFSSFFGTKKCKDALSLSQQRSAVSLCFYPRFPLREKVLAALGGNRFLVTTMRGAVEEPAATLFV